MTFLLRRAEETEVTPGWRASLDLRRVRATITVFALVVQSSRRFPRGGIRHQRGARGGDGSSVHSTE